MLHKKRKPSQTFTNSISGDTKVNAANNMLHSKSTYFYRWGFSSGRLSYVVPAACGVALLCGVGIILNPATKNNVLDGLVGSSDYAYAETVTVNPTSYSSVSMTISNTASGELSSGDTVTTNVEPGLVNYIDNNIKISTSRIDRFYVTVQAAENGSSELTGTAHGETIAPVTANTPTTNFTNNTWGFALGEADTSNASMNYNPLPSYNTATAPQYLSAQNLVDGDYNLKLTFAAKINADKPSDHYTTKAMVSVAADAKEITTMQEFAEVGLCSSMKENEQRQLVDDRSASGLGQTKYWIAKLKDGKCWMTQNLDLALTAGAELSSADTDIVDASGKYNVPTSLGNYKDPGMVNYIFGSGYNSSSCGDPTASGCSKFFETYTKSDVSGDEKAHYLIGNYYPWAIATAGKTAENQGSICPKGWKLPTNSEYSTLINGVTYTTILDKPYYYSPAGYCSSGYDFVALEGDYWSSTPSSSSYAYNLRFYSGNLNMGIDVRARGFPVRCVLK